ncbi:hypothetical protein QQF64_034733, partial [Cirrhinus molitorella]
MVLTRKVIGLLGRCLPVLFKKVGVLLTREHSMHLAKHNTGGVPTPFAVLARAHIQSSLGHREGTWPCGYTGKGCRTGALGSRKALSLIGASSAEDSSAVIRCD